MTPVLQRPPGEAPAAPGRPSLGPLRTVLRQGLGPLLVIAMAGGAATVSHGAHVMTVTQKDRAFSVPNVSIDRGDTIRFTNEDGFLHQMFAHSALFSFDSDEQKPGQDVEVEFPVAGRFQVLCGIHPKMRLDVEVR